MAFGDEPSFFLKPSKTPAKGEWLDLGLLDLWLSDPIGEFEPTDRGLLELSEDPDFFEEKKSFVFLKTIFDFFAPTCVSKLQSLLRRRRGRGRNSESGEANYIFFRGRRS